VQEAAAIPERWPAAILGRIGVKTGKTRSLAMPKPYSQEFVLAVFIQISS
jgi:hypothetical protein